MKAKAYTKGIANPHTHCQRIANPLERVNTYLHNYRNQGLYLDHGVDIVERIHYYGWKAMVERDFAPQWWHFVYKIPRLY